jgi:F0F1-type ATP synthase assembly protein I
VGMAGDGMESTELRDPLSETASRKETAGVFVMVGIDVSMIGIMIGIVGGVLFGEFLGDVRRGLITRSIIGLVSSIPLGIDYIYK